MIEQLNWVATCDELPREDIPVLVFCEHNRRTYVGYIYRILACHVWRTMEGNAIEGVTHWAEMPRGPSVEVAK